MVSLAHKFAFETPQVKTEAISAIAMPELAQRYHILGTPHTVLNGETHLKGRLSEAQLLEAIQLKSSQWSVASNQNLSGHNPTDD